MEFLINGKSMVGYISKCACIPSEYRERDLRSLSQWQKVKFSIAGIFSKGVKSVDLGMPRATCSRFRGNHSPMIKLLTRVLSSYSMANLSLASFLFPLAITAYINSECVRTHLRFCDICGHKVGGRKRLIDKDR